MTEVVLPAIKQPARPASGRRETIARAAMKVFVHQGYRGASVDAIAVRAGVSKQTIYNYFSGKEQLFVAAMEHARECVLLAVEEVAEPGVFTSLEDELAAYARRVLQITLDPKVAALRRLLIAEMGKHAALDESCSAGTPERVIADLAERIERLNAEGRAAVADPEAAADQFLSVAIYQGLRASKYGTIALTEAQTAEICASAARLFVRAHG